MADRAVLFIDGSNWFHALRENGVKNTADLNYAAISKKLVGPRDWAETRYYGVALDQATAPEMYANNRRFLDQIQNDDGRITVHLGRVEPRPVANPLVDEMENLIYRERPPQELADQIRLLLRRYRNLSHYTEKGVDVSLAVDMFRLARAGEYDAAYLLSADGDFVPAVEAVKELEKKVYAACPNFGSALDKCCNTFIRMDRKWFDDCYR